MSIVQCSECQNNVNDDSDRCPHCGVVTKKKDFSGLQGIFIFVLCVSFAIYLISAPNDKSNNGPSDSTSTVVNACLAAQDAVKKYLKAPASAKFPGCVLELSEYTIKTNEQKNPIMVFGHVDSQNSFGALIRSNFAVEFDTMSDPEHYSSWRTKNIAIE